MADHGMNGGQPRQGALDGGDELHGGQLVAGRFAVRRHVEGDGSEAALDQRRDDGRELRAVALEAMDQQHDRALAPAPGNKPVAEIDALVGQRQRQRRRRPHVAARVQHHAAEERRHQRRRDVARGGKSGDRQGKSGHAELR